MIPIMLPLRILAQGIHVPVAISPYFQDGNFATESRVFGVVKREGVACLKGFLLGNDLIGRNRPVTEKMTSREMAPLALRKFVPLVIEPI